MPVFVRWQWKEKTKTYLVIFYFFDDKSRENIRFRFKVITRCGELTQVEEPKNNPEVQCQPLMTWAPTHLEIALLGDVLRYANIIDGLGITEKRKLRDNLEIQSSEKDPYIIDAELWGRSL